MYIYIYNTHIYIYLYISQTIVHLKQNQVFTEHRQLHNGQLLTFHRPIERGNRIIGRASELRAIGQARRWKRMATWGNQGLNETVNLFFKS